MKQKFEKWNRWFSEISREISNLVITKNKMSEVREIIRRNKKIHKPNIFYTILGNMYTSYIIIGLRRLTKSHRCSITLTELIEEIKEFSKSITKKYLMSLCDRPFEKKIVEDYFKKFEDKTGTYVDSDKVQKDLEELENKTKKFEYYANKRIAHLDRSRLKSGLITIGEAEDLIDFLAELHIKYYLLISGNQRAFNDPYSHEWKDIFKEAWLTEYDD